MNATLHQILFNRSPIFHCFDVYNQNFWIRDINNQSFTNEQDDQLINKNTQWLRNKMTFYDLASQPSTEKTTLS